MKINNDFIILDLEATSNQIDTIKPIKQENNFIIEIGAVYVNSNLEIKSTFEHLVKPEETITPFITNLTGISNNDVETKPTWNDVSKKFENWAQSNSKNLKSVKLCAWGNYFDMNLLKKVYNYYGLKFPFSGTMYDIKTIAMIYCALSGKGVKKLSVSSMSQFMDINPNGSYHRALVDAKNTAEIFIQIMKKLRDGHFIQYKNEYKYLKIE